MRDGAVAMAGDATTMYDSADRLAGRRPLRRCSSSSPCIVLFPIYTTVVAALKPGNKVLDNPLVPDAFTLDVLREAWTEGHLGRYLLNSIVVAVIVTVAQVVTSVLSAYAFAMLEFPGRNVLFVVFLATMLVPLEATLVVNRRTVDSLGWLNTLPGPGRAVPRHRVRHVPHPPGVPDAAARPARRGGDRRRRPPRVPAPRRRAARAPDDRRAGRCSAFLSSWNQYLWPNLITTEADMYTLQSGLQLAQPGPASTEPNLVMAGVIIAVRADRRRAAVFQRQLVRGLTAGRGEGMRPRRRRASLAAARARWPACASGESILAGRQRAAAADDDDRTGPPSTRGAGRDRCRRRRRRPIATTTTTPLASLPPCPVDALDDVTAPVEITFWHGLGGEIEDALIDAHRRSTTPARTRSASRLENQGGYKQTIDKYVQSSQDEPAGHGDVPGVHGPADRRLRHGRSRSGRASRRAASTRRRSCPGAARATRPRACSGRCRSTSATRSSTTTGRCSRRPASTRTTRRCRSRSCGRRRRRSSTPARRRRASPSTPASTPAAAGSSSSGSPGPASLRRQRQRPAGAGDAGALRRAGRRRR